MIKFDASESQAGARLDLIVSTKIPQISRSSVRKLCDDSKVLVNNMPEKASYKLRFSDKVTVNFDPNELQQIPTIDLPKIYEDNDCVVIDKPVGLLTHSKGAFNPESTVASYIQPMLVDISDDRAGIVHRLDRATSGVIICAKTHEALKWLQKQFSQRKTKKTYVAVVSGHIKPTEAIIDMPIERNPKDPKSFRVGSSGKPAITNYKVLKSNDQFDMVELYPTTGRTHQLRVHLKTIGHPIVGDPVYGGENFQRMLLHAHKLEITLLNKSRKIFESAVPNQFRDIMK